jgi:hypothetical protein
MPIASIYKDTEIRIPTTHPQYTRTANKLELRKFEPKVFTKEEDYVTIPLCNLDEKNENHSGHICFNRTHDPGEFTLRATPYEDKTEETQLEIDVSVENNDYVVRMRNAAPNTMITALKNLTDNTSCNQTFYVPEQLTLKERIKMALLTSLRMVILQEGTPGTLYAPDIKIVHMQLTDCISIPIADSEDNIIYLMQVFFPPCAKNTLRHMDGLQ